MVFSLLARLPGPFKGIAERFDKTPIDTVGLLFRFASTRASFVAQTALFGYLRARMGTQFREYFQDDIFSQVIRDSAVRIFVSCLSDVTVFVVANVADSGRLGPEEAGALARRCFDRGMRTGLVDIDPAKIPADAHERFEQRLRETDWSAAAAGDAAFALSPADLVRFAPVTDDFKKRDRPIVATSIGHNWREVRDTFRRRAAPASIAAEWRRAAGS